MSREDARINRRKCLATKHRHIPYHSFIPFRVKLILPPMLVHCRKCVSEIGWGNRAIEILAEHKKCVEDWKRKAAIPQKIEGKKRRTFDKKCSKLFLPSPLKWYNNAMVIATQERCWKNKGNKDFLRKPKLIPFVMENGKPFICSKPFMCLLYRPPLLPLAAILIAVSVSQCLHFFIHF